MLLNWLKYYTHDLHSIRENINYFNKLITSCIYNKMTILKSLMPKLLTQPSSLHNALYKLIT